MPQQASTPLGRSQGDTLQLRAARPLDAVVCGQRLIQHGKIGPQKIQGTQILVQYLSKKVMRFMPHVRLQVGVEVGIVVRIDGDPIYSGQIEPLIRELFNE